MEGSSLDGFIGGAVALAERPRIHRYAAGDRCAGPGRRPLRSFALRGSSRALHGRADPERRPRDHPRQLTCGRVRGALLPRKQSKIDLKPSVATGATIGLGTPKTDAAAPTLPHPCSLTCGGAGGARQSHRGQRSDSRRQPGAGWAPAAPAPVGVQWLRQAAE